MSEKKHTKYPSRFEIGESAILKLSNCEIPVYIRAVLFTNGKVRYSLYVKHDKTTIHHVDSYFVDEDTADFGDDDYS